MLVETLSGLTANIGDTVCLVDPKTQLPVSSEFTVIGIAHRSGPKASSLKYLYLSDGAMAYRADSVRVVQKKSLNTEENSDA